MSSNTPSSRARFLTAEWRSLLMANYVVKPEVLTPYLPAGVELDLWEGKALASMVGFLFLRTRVLGVPFPFHQDFEEVNLRFYVKHRAPEGWRRGVVFVKEIVPKPIISTVARVVYDEPYVAMPMRHRVEIGAGQSGLVEYGWKSRSGWNSLSGRVHGDPVPLESGSPAEFIFEHYWGYTRRRDGSTSEYEVSHAAWRSWVAHDVEFRCDVADIYGQEWVDALNVPPVSAFVAEGSPVAVRMGMRLPPG